MENKTQDLVTDCCGAFMDVGAVIGEEDCILSRTVSAENEAAAQALFTELADQAKARYSSVEVKTEWLEESKQLKGSLIFSCAAERLIFEMQLG